MALLSALCMASFSCEGGGGDDSSATTREGEDLELVDSPSVTRTPLALGERLPDEAFVGEGLVFGDPDPETVLALGGYLADPLVADAAAREIFDSDTEAPLAAVLALALAPDGFSDTTAIEAYVRGMTVAFGDGSASDAIRLDLGEFEGYASSSEAASVVAFGVDNLVVVVDADAPATASSVATRVADAIAAGAEPDLTTVEPLTEIDKESAFVELKGFDFAPFPASESEQDFESLPAPVLDGLAGLPEGRLVLVGNEIRGVAWSIPVSREAYPSATDLDAPMSELAQNRSGGEVTVSRIAGRAVLAGDAEEPIRILREQNLVLVVDGLDSDDADAIAAAWARALAG